MRFLKTQATFAGMQQQTEAERKQEEDRLYFGTQVVTLRVADGKSHLFFENFIAEDKSLTARDVAARRQRPAEYLGKDYAILVLPGMPSLDFVRTDTVPVAAPVFSSPLIKANTGDNLIEGLQSGRRSALVSVSNKWYRLKGCGNLYQGFNTQPVGDRPHLREIRGCMFAHTVSRELCMTNLINRIMHENGIPAANKPVGWFDYSSTADGMPNQFPAVQRCCGVFEAAGERRLADHVLSGLDGLLPTLIPLAQIPATLASLFPPSRQAGTNDFVPTWISVVSESPLSDFADFVTLPLHLHVPEAATKDQVLAKAWTRARAHLNSFLHSKESNVLALAFWRLGREAGAVVRTLAAHQISWGTYSDLLGTHCNAHPNNLVVVPACHSATHLLAPLDFDMAFTRDSFIHESTDFAELMQMERNAMCAALAGDHHLNSGVLAIAELPPQYQLLKWALRDTLVRGYTSAISNSPDDHVVSSNELMAIRSLIELALVTTAAHIT